MFIAATFGMFLNKLRFVVTPETMGETDATRRTLWPQYLVLGLNARAIPTGVVLYLDTGHLPTNRLWVRIVSSWLVVRYRSRISTLISA